MVRTQVNNLMHETSPADEARGGVGGSIDGLELVQVSDQAIMARMRTQSGTSILELAERLSVTDTAVRQRLTRLMDRGLVERFALREGRGRPKHVYRLTEAGQRASGANLDDLAVALWQELVELEDIQLRERLLRRVVGRLIAKYSAEVFGTTVEDRLKSVVELFNRRGIPFAFERSVSPAAGDAAGDAGGTGGPAAGDAGDACGPAAGGAGQSAGGQLVGRLVVLGCPYPGLKEDQRLVCRMEQLLFQGLIGVPLEDVTDGFGEGGNICCSFVPLQGAGRPVERLGSGQTVSGQLGLDQGVRERPVVAQCGKSHCDCH